MTARGKATSKGADASTQPAPEPTPPPSPTSHSQTLPTTTPNQDLPSLHVTHTPSSPPLIAVMPLTMVEIETTPVPLDKGKGVVVIPSEDDEDTEDGQVFKRRRTNKVVTSHSSSNHGVESLREHPPSATSPPHQLASGGGVESTSTPDPTPAPELPHPVQGFIKGFLHKATLRGSTDTTTEEGVAYCIGEYLSNARSWREQAEAKANDCLALEKELALLNEQTQAQERRWFHQEVSYKETLKEAQQAKNATNKRLHEAGQTYAQLLGQTVPLRVKIDELQDAVEASKIQQKKLEDHCGSREEKLGEVEAALNAKIEAFDLLQANFSKLQAEKDEALEAKDKEMASQAERFERAEKELVDNAEGAFVEGFAEALAQVACANPGIDVSSCGPLNHIVKGKIVPLAIPED